MTAESDRLRKAHASLAAHLRDPESRLRYRTPVRGSVPLPPSFGPTNLEPVDRAASAGLPLVFHGSYSRPFRTGGCAFRENIFSPLPATIGNQITTYEQREQYLLNFLQNVLPSCDVKDIGEELRRSFAFNKHKRKITKKKPQKSLFLTMRKSILLGLNKFGKKSIRYKDMLPLNELWLDYMHHMLVVRNFTNLPINSTNSRWESTNQRLAKADYHGAKVTIIRSKCPSTIGIEGIIIQDTKNTFRLLCRDDVIRTIPKVSCIFRLHLENDVYVEVFGKELCIRPTERSVKKFKNLQVLEL